MSEFEVFQKRQIFFFENEKKGNPLIARISSMRVRLMYLFFLFFCFFLLFCYQHLCPSVEVFCTFNCSFFFVFCFCFCFCFLRQEYFKLFFG